MENVQFPALLLPESKKGNTWRKQCVDFADSKLHFNYSLIRKSILNMKINYDLLDGILHMEDLLTICNPEGLKAEFIPTTIQHYPIINSKLNVLKGEESKRIFDFKVIVTNPNAITEVENNKKEALLKSLQELILLDTDNEEDINEGLEKINDYYTYEWLDFREVKANCILNHYIKEYNIPLIFNLGFMDAMAVGEEVYLCDIVGGEPVVEKLNPRFLRVFRSGYSNRIEDADLIIYPEYWPVGRVYDTYYDVLTTKDIKYIESSLNSFTLGAVDSMDNIDERLGFVNVNMMTDLISDSTVFFDPLGLYTDVANNDLLPFDNFGNIRVMRVYWKSRKKIKKIKFYDPKTGDEDFTFMPESYLANLMLGEEEESFWINEAWEGTKIGSEVYVNIRPRVILYNRLDNPSRCHFGIIGTIYNINNDRPFSMVDMMKPYSYMYDIIHDRLNKMMARNWGKMTRLDLAKKPKAWKMEKWLYYAKAMGLFVEDSFNEGSIGAATNKLAGALNSNSLGVIDADFGNNILLYINLLEFIKLEMSEVAGISKQREGLISNRETVGGVERATLLSSHITEWLFNLHDDVKKRVLECFLETAKIAMRGRTKKFLYIMPDYSIKLLEIDGDEFAESDYGLVVDNNNGIQELLLKLETLALAALLNLSLSFSTIMKLFMSASVAEKQRFILNDERRIRQEALLVQLMLMLEKQQELLAQLLAKQLELQAKEAISQRESETKIAVAEINSLAEFAILLLKNNLVGEDGIEELEYSLEAKDRLLQDMKLFDERLKLDREKLEFEKLKHKEDNLLKERLSRLKSNTK